MLDLSPVVGHIPYRLALAGGWIDQPFVSSLNPNPPGAMVVIGIEPTIRFMDRSGMATGTRKVASRIWGDRIPEGDPWELMRELYTAENEGFAEPSGSQDMAGLIFPGVNRLDYDATVEGGYFPAHIESNLDPDVADWLERVVHIVPVAPRPEGYNPLGIKNLDPAVIAELGQSGKDCFDAIVARDIGRLGQSFNACMRCWESLLPDILHHRTLTVDLCRLLACYQAEYPGAMYSGCGGGYLYVLSEEPVPGSFTIEVRRR